MVFEFTYHYSRPIQISSLGYFTHWLVLNHYLLAIYFDPIILRGYRFQGEMMHLQKLLKTIFIDLKILVNGLVIDKLMVIIIKLK